MITYLYSSNEIAFIQNIFYNSECQMYNKSKFLAENNNKTARTKHGIRYFDFPLGKDPLDMTEK